MRISIDPARSTRHVLTAMKLAKPARPKADEAAAKKPNRPYTEDDLLKTEF